MSPSPLTTPASTPAQPSSAPAESPRTAANRANSLKSTGPKTAAGKQRARMNAYRHGLTSQRVIFELEDSVAYFALGRRWIQRLKPVGITEIQLAQKIVDSCWRIDRAAAVEQSMFADGAEAHLRYDGRPLNVDLALANARAFVADCEGPNAFLKITLYQSRLERSLIRFREMFKQEQAERKASGEDVSFDADALEPEERKALDWYTECHAAAKGEVERVAAIREQSQAIAEQREPEATPSNAPSNAVAAHDALSTETADESNKPAPETDSRNRSGLASFCQKLGIPVRAAASAGEAGSESPAWMRKTPPQAA
jgi:hypothetical protein